jgi:hypothetical protein
MMRGNGIQVLPSSHHAGMGFATFQNGAGSSLGKTPA